MGMLAAAACLFPAAPGLRAQTPSLEYQVKASMLFNFLQFVDWPPGALDGSGDLVLGVLGHEPLGKALDVMNGESVNGRTLRVVRIPGPDAPELMDCHAVFVSRDRMTDALAVLQRLKGRPVLTIGETSEFLDQGGVIAFVNTRGRVNFAINRAAEKEAGLVCSSKLLRLASLVRDP
jgi:hypothetical protein